MDQNPIPPVPPRMEDDIFLEARHIVKAYSAHKALDDVSIQVPRGKIFGLLGPNGAGKTTLIRIINHISMPDAGEIVFNGHALCADDVQNIGYLPEERGLYKKMKVGEQAIYLAQLRGLTAAEAKSRLKEWFEKFDIMPWWNKKLEELSKGMQQKVQFIITLVHQPELLIFDEPFSGFDPVNAERLKKEILELRDKGHTIIFSTHNMASVEEICDHIVLIDHSKVVLSGNVAEIKSRYRTGLYELLTPNAYLTAEPGVYDIIESKRLGVGCRYLVKKADALSNSQLIAHLAEKAEIVHFSEQMPSMNDIFLQIVGQK